ncbi:MAG: glycosyltransferase family 2 protein [Armatimonadota bacterium]|nr:glycosyltransferase [bacterium]
MDDPIISVVVCTWNRCELLRRCLTSLCKQTINPSNYEVVVVDNNSTDETPSVVREMTVGTPVKILYVRETRQGLSIARNRGVEISRGEYVWFVDDDAVARPDALQLLFRALKETTADIIGGRVVDVSNGGKQGADLGLNLGCERRFMVNGEYVWGGNMAIRRSLVQQIGGFREDLGCSGSKRLVGEDTEMCDRIRKAGNTICWEPSVIVDHCPSEERLRCTARVKAAFFYGVAQVRQRFGVNARLGNRCYVAASSFIAMLLYFLCCVLTVCSRGRCIKCVMHIFRCFGKLAAALGIY